MHKNVIKLTSVIATLVTLTACQTTATQSKSYSTDLSALKQDYINNKLDFSSESVNLTKNNGTITVKVDGKTNDFTNADLKTSQNNTKYYSRETGDEYIYLKSVSDNKFATEYGLKTDNVGLWFIDSGNAKTKTYKSGYAVFGDKPETTSSAKTTTYNGRVQGQYRNKGSLSIAYLKGESHFTADFNAQSITGGFDNLYLYGENFDDTKLPDAVISNGKITNNSFSGNLQQGSFAAGTINGGFYGENAIEIGGTAQLENDLGLIVFGFTGK